MCKKILHISCDQMPLFFRNNFDIYSLLGDFQDFYEHDETVFTQQNKLHPWIRVTAVRVDDKDCVHQWLGGVDKCLVPLHEEELLDDDFEEAPFNSDNTVSIRSRFASIPSKGNSKTYKVEWTQTDGVSKFNWRQKLNEEIFRNPLSLLNLDFKLKPNLNDIPIPTDENKPETNWFQDPTRAIYLTLNFFNEEQAMAFEVKVVI